MCVHDYLGGHGSMVNRSITRIAAAGAVKLSEIVIPQLYSTAESGRFITMMRKFHVHSG